MDERSLELVLIVAIGAAAFLLLRFVFRDRLNQFYANNRRGRLIAGGGRSDLWYRRLPPYPVSR